MAELLGEDGEALRALGVDAERVARAAVSLAATLRAGGKLLVFGNGGSAADAQHFAAELVGRFERERRPLPAIALTTDSSAITAIANDYGFEHVFSRQVEALGQRGDMAVAISTSGSSPNVLEAVASAKRAGLLTVGLCGAPGCRLCEQVDIALVAPAGGTAGVQEKHVRIEHAICRALERLLFEPTGDFETRPPGSVVTLEELVAMRSGWREEGRIVVWTNGCFDLLHAGHLDSLRAARELGEILVVGVNGDAAVARLKGEGRPLVPAQERAQLLAALRPVDYVTVFEEDTPEAVLAQVRPDVHTKGADYGGPNGKPIPERELVESYGGRVALLALLPERSTSSLVESIRGPRT